VERRYSDAGVIPTLGQGIRRPHLDGREVIQTLKVRHDTNHMPVSALSVLNTIDDENACYREGADAFLNDG
jgi:CheY-like chemotaxis protein